MAKKPAKIAEKAIVVVAKTGWAVFNKLNSFSPNASFTPKWSDKPLLKSYQKEKPPLGWPRTTDSLCPRCVPEIRQQIVDGMALLAIERTIERLQHLKLDRLECRGGAITRAREIDPHFLEQATRPRLHHQNPVRQHHGFIDIVGDENQRRLRIGPQIEQMVL